MIKFMYTPQFIEEEKDTEYEQVLKRCRNYQKEFSIQLSNLSGENYDNFVRAKIEEYVFEEKPRVSSLVFDGKMNYDRLTKKLYKDINQFGPITDFLKNPEDITDIACWGVGKGKLKIHKGKLVEDARDENGNLLYFKSDEEIKIILNKLIYSTGERLDKSSQVVRTSVNKDNRLSIVDSSAASPINQADGELLKETTFSIRIPRKEDITMEDMIYREMSYHPDLIKNLVLLTRISGLKFILAGVPGSGKTKMMEELLKIHKDKAVVALEQTHELDIQEYDENGVAQRMFISWLATSKEGEAEDMYKANLINLYYATLSMRFDILAMTEVRAVQEMNVYMRASTSGRSVWTTAHGENFDMTVEVLVKSIMEAKHCSRSEATSEVSLCVDLIAGLMHNEIDNTIRMTFLSEVVSETTETGVILKENRLFEFHQESRDINPVTGKVNGYYRKIGTPSKKLEGYIKRTKMTQEEEDFLMLKATPENPINYSKEWSRDV